MLQNIKSATKNSIIYGFGNISIKLVGLILIPIYTDPKYLTFEDFGRLGLLEVTSILLSAVLGLSLSQGISRWYWDDLYKEKQKSITFTILFFLFIIGIAFLTFSWFSADAFSQLLFSTPNFGSLLFIVILASTLQVEIVLIQTIMKLQQRSGFFAITNTIKLIVTLSITIYLVVFKKMAVEGIYIAQVLGNIFFLLIVLKYISGSIQIRFEMKALKGMLAYSMPLILASVSAILLSSQDRYILNHYSSLNDVGIYSLAYRMSNTIKLLVVTSVQMAVSPMLFQMMNNKNRHRFYSKYMTYFALVVTLFTILLNLFCFEILKIFTSDINYWKAAYVIPIISFALLFDMLKDTSLTGLQIQKKTWIISSVVILIACINMGLSFLMIPFWNYHGAAAATLISEIIFFILIYHFAQKHYKIPYELRKVLMLILIAMIFSAIAYFINEKDLLFRLVVKTLMVISFPFILWMMKFYDAIELERIHGFVRKWKDPSNWTLRKGNSSKKGDE